MFVKQEHKATVQEKRMVLKVQGGGEGRARESASAEGKEGNKARSLA